MCVCVCAHCCRELGWQQVTVDRGKQRRTNLSLKRKVELLEEFWKKKDVVVESGVTAGRESKCNVTSKDKLTAVVP